jgi:predicted HicB family RNase H-like nuclease
MKNVMRYKGYTARIEYETDSGVFVGNVLGLSEQISFHGASVDELRSDFEFAIDHYLAACKAAGVTPDKQAAGKVLLRLSAESHAAALVAAQSKGISLNEWLVAAIEEKLGA